MWNLRGFPGAQTVKSPPANAGGTQKNGIHGLICKAETETDAENKCTDTKEEEGWWDEWEVGVDILILGVK